MSKKSARKTIVEVYEDRAKRWRFRQKNRNGKVTKPSQSYSTRMNARRAAHRDCPGLDVISV